MITRLLLAGILLTGCKKSADHAPGSPKTESAQGSTAPPPGSAAPNRPRAKDAAMKQMLDKGTTCQRAQGTLPLDCAELKVITDYAFQHQGSSDVSETCAAYLQDPEPTKRLLAAGCLKNMSSAGVTPALGAALDAIEAETDANVRKQITWGIRHAEAVTAKLDDRVITVITKLASDPKSEEAAADLLRTLFPMYLAGTAPRPSPKAQALAIDAIKRNGTAMQRAAFSGVKLIDDKPGVCAALEEAMRPGGEAFWGAVEAYAEMKDACAATLPGVIGLVVNKISEGKDVQPGIVTKLDNWLELDAATRTKLAKALKAGRKEAPEWKRKAFDDAAANLSKPKELKKT